MPKKAGERCSKAGGQDSTTKTLAAIMAQLRIRGYTQFAPYFNEINQTITQPGSDAL